RFSRPPPARWERGAQARAPMRGSILQARRSKRPRRGRGSSSDDLPPASPAGVLAWRGGDALRLRGCIPPPGGLVVTEDGERMAAGPVTCALDLRLPGTLP